MTNGELQELLKAYGPDKFITIQSDKIDYYSETFAIEVSDSVDAKGNEYVDIRIMEE